jgi:hypothetical protein
MRTCPNSSGITSFCNETDYFFKYSKNAAGRDSKSSILAKIVSSNAASQIELGLSDFELMPLNSIN